MVRRTSLPRVCVALGCSDSSTLRQQSKQEIDNGESFLEFRLDYLPCPKEGVEIIRELTTINPQLTVLATCRREGNGGHFKGSIDEQLSILSDALGAGARVVDVEIETAELVADRLAELQCNALLVISYHNFESTPSITGIMRRVKRVSADAYKIVTTARKPSDILRVLTLLKTHSKEKLILLAMGDTGVPSRVLAPAFGGLFTYGAPASVDGTAPGQICARQLRNLYHVEKLSRHSRIYGVIADPVRHSLSPALHNRALQARRIDACYLPFRVSPGHLRDFMTVATELPVAGFSVTIPHKEKIVRYVDIIDPLARRIGAVNTVWRKAGKWRGTNTDVAGVLVPLKKRINPAKASVLIIGNGGAARGAAFALADAGATVSITGRTDDRVRALARATGVEAIAADQLGDRHFDIAVHATPLGMYPNIDGCFFRDKIPADLVFEMVYNPLDTALVRRAREQGIEVIPGTEMFVEQAARQFETWTEDSAPRAVMERAVMDALGHGPREGTASA